MDSDPKPEELTSLGPYTIVRLIGRGGMGEVYQAFEERLNRHVALKVISPAMARDYQTVVRFLQEGKTLALISHQNIVSIYNIDQTDGRHFIAMEYIEGRPLSEIVRNLVLSSSEATPLFIQMLEGLQALHAKNIVHRDLKPQNIIYQRDNIMKIVDFGIAKVYGGAESMTATTTGMIIGTLQYIAPEIGLGKPATQVSDIFSLGAIFYEMMTGSKLVRGDNQIEALTSLAQLKVEFPPETTRWVAPEMQRIVKRMCARDMNERYKSCGEVLADLRAFAAQNPSGVLWHYRVIGKKLPNAETVRQQMVHKGLSTATAKRVLAQAVADDLAKGTVVAADKTQVITAEDSLTITSESLRSAFQKVSTSRMQVPSQRKPWPWAVAVGVVVAAVGFGLWPKLRPAAPVPPAVKAEPAKVEVTKPAEPAKPEPTQAASIPALEPEPTKAAPVVVDSPKPIPAQKPVVEADSGFDMETPAAEKVASRLVLKGASSAPVLKWSPVKNAVSYTVEVATSPSFNKIVFTHKTKDLSVQWKDVLPGEFHWRVRARNKKGEWSNFSTAQRFKAEIEPLQFTQKEFSKEVDVSSDAEASSAQPEVVVAWKENSIAKRYKLQVSRSPSFEDTIETKIVAQPSGNVRAPAGLYYVRVAALDRDEGPISQPSSPARVILSVRQLIKAPEVVAPPDGAMIMGASSGAAPVVFFWRKVASVAKYEIEVSKEKSFAETIARQTVPDTRLILKQKLSPGTYYWRVRSLGSQSNSAWSVPRGFRAD